VQDVSVRSDGSDAVTEQLLKELDLNAIKEVMQRCATLIFKRGKPCIRKR
jgi:hypothetical protein